MNLADAKPRDLKQADLIGRRPSIIPGQRNTRAPALEQFATLASARRGDGGAAELMRTLGIAQKGLSDFAEYAANKHEADEQENIAQGTVDQLTANVDPVMQEKSEGYRNAVTKGRAVSAVNDGHRELERGIRELTESQRSPDLAARQAEARALIEQSYRDLTLDPQSGNPREDFQSSTALRYLAEAIGKTRPQFEAAAMERIEVRFNEEARAHAGKNVIDQLEVTSTLDVDQFLSILPKTVPAERVRETFVNAIPEAARKLWEGKASIDGLRVFDAILGAPKAPNVAIPAAPAGTAQSAPVAISPPATGRISTTALEAAVEFVESRGNPNAVSPKGARGRMQTMPGTLRDPGFGVRPAKNDSEAELTRVGKDYLAAMRSRYDGDLVFALAAYNWGPGRVDEWKASVTGKSTAQKIAAIPVKETREYVRNVLARASGGATGGAAVAPDDPVQATPGFRLARPDADPVTAYEASGEVPTLLGIERLGLSAEDLGKLREERDRLASRIRTEWTRKTNEEQELNATGMALSLFGQGRPVTSVDITRAVESQAVTPQQAMQLYGILRQNTNATQSYADRQEARADRSARKAQEDQVAAISGRYIAGILSGRMTGPEARSAVLAELPSIRDPKVQAAVANSVLASSGDIENLAVNSKAVREAVRLVADSRDQWLAQAGPKAARLAPQIDSLLDQAQAEIATRVRDGEDAAAAERAVLARYKPKLDALTARRKAPK